MSVGIAATGTLADIPNAVRILAARDAFTSRDREFGESIATKATERWSPKMFYSGWKMLGNYRSILAALGIDYAALPKPANPYAEAAKPMRRAVLASAEDGTPLNFEFSFPYDPRMIALVKQLPQRMWQPQRRVWTVRATNLNIDVVSRFIFDNDFEADQETEAFLGGTLEAFREVRQRDEAMIEASKAEASDFNVVGLGGELRPFQRAGCEYASLVMRCLIGDEMGLGKTIEALATVESAHAYPALVICPASLKPNWLREASVWLPHRSVAVLEKDPTLFASKADIVITNYESLHKYEVFIREHAPTWQALVADESHYCKTPTSLRTKLTQGIAEMGMPYRLLLTGTPVLNRPEELIAQLEILDMLEAMGGKAEFRKRYVKGGMYQELNDRLRATCYLRRTKAQVLTELPDKIRTITPIAIDNRVEYQEAYDDVVKWVRDHAAERRKFLKSIEHITDEKLRDSLMREHANSAAERAARAEAIVRINALKFLVGKGKLKAAIAWTRDFLENGEKLVFFCHHREIQEAVQAAFPGCARLDADDKPADRQANVDRFQDDPACRLIVCGIAVGGLGWTLTAASNVATLELGWTPAEHKQAEDRCHRMGQRDSVTAWYLLAEETIDMWIMELLDEKLKVVTASTDGGEVDEESLLSAILRKLRGPSTALPHEPSFDELTAPV